MPNGRQARITKEEVLALLRRGNSIRSIFINAGYKNTSTYYDWRKRDPDFASRADAILDGFSDPKKEEPVFAGPPEDALESDSGDDSGGHAPFDPEVDDWREAFVREYRRTRSRVRAMALVGMSAARYIEVTTEGDDEYDAAFAAAMEEVHLEEAIAMEDKLRRRAVNENDRHAIDKVLPLMPKIGEKYSKEAAKQSGGAGESLAVIFHLHNRERAIKEVGALIDSVAGKEIKEIEAPAPNASWND